MMSHGHPCLLPSVSFHPARSSKCSTCEPNSIVSRPLLWKKRNNDKRDKIGIQSTRLYITPETVLHVAGGSHDSVHQRMSNIVMEERVALHDAQVELALVGRMLEAAIEALVAL